MTNDEVFFESYDDGRISAAVLNRGAKRNAMSPALSKALQGILDVALNDLSHVFLLRSAVPGAFCAGFDISYIGTDQHHEGERAMSGCFTSIGAAKKVTIAFADGFVFGGGVELYLAADLRLATPRTTFRITPARLGVVYSFHGLSRFVSIMGVTAATELLLAAQTLTADEALRVGLVTRIVPDEAAAMAYCRQVASLAPLAQQAMKAMLKKLAGKIAPPEASEAEWLQLQALRDTADASEDQREGRRAFAEKREPRFTGR